MFLHHHPIIMKYSNTWLLQQLAENQSFKYIYFWGHTPPKDGSISKSCFSQWFERPFVHEEITYPTAEHWMMAEKARLFKDDEILEKILKATSAAEAKKLGRQVKNWNEKTWIDHRSSIVCNGNYLKFTQHEDLKDFLLQTNDRVLVEASPYDKIWGIGMKAEDPGIEYPGNWKGLNLLGYALMEVRDKIRTER